MATYHYLKNFDLFGFDHAQRQAIVINVGQLKETNKDQLKLLDDVDNAVNAHDLEGLDTPRYEAARDFLKKFAIPGKTIEQDGKKIVKPGMTIEQMLSVAYPEPERTRSFSPK